MSEPRKAEELYRLKPPSATERRQRAMYMAAQAGRHAVVLIRKCLDHCDVIDFNGNGAQKQRPDVPPIDHYNSIKEMTTLSLWLSLAEQMDAGSPPDWLEDFFVESYSAVDHLFSESDHPNTQEIMANYPGKLELTDLYQTAAMRLCSMLQAGDTVADAALFFEQTVNHAAASRATILGDALRRPLTDLEKMIDEDPPV